MIFDWFWCNLVDVLEVNQWIELKSYLWKLGHIYLSLVLGHEADLDDTCVGS